MFQHVSPKKSSVSRQKNSATADVFQALDSRPNLLSRDNRVIQRAVGFEIEIKYSPFRDAGHLLEFVKHRDPYRDYGIERFNKDDVLMKGQGFELRVDLVHQNQLPYLEFVTDPFEETLSGWRKLNAAFDTMVSIMRDLVDASQENRYNVDFFQVFKKYGEIERKNRAIRMIGRLPLDSGLFQMTAGIALERIPVVFQDIAWPEPGEDPVLFKRREAGRDWLISWKKEKADLYILKTNRALKLRIINEVIRELRTSFPDKVAVKMTGAIPWTAKLEGLLSMIGQYLLFAHHKLERYPKYFSTLLGRTDFASMFQLLGDEEKEFFRKDRNWFHLVDQLVERLGIGGIVDPVFSKGIYHDYGPRFEDKRYVLDPLSRMSWLMELPNNRDFLTEGFFPIPEYKHLFKSFGEFGSNYDSVDIAGRKEQVPIFEFRTISKRPPCSEWKTFAQEAYQWIRALNAGADSKFGEWREPEDFV
ncbi:MAG: hypothetical protein MI784_16525 [Cytophagales bacterium]|nr:hypothetical protein [Cytophagales bacterium]